ncbi:hypothetical protein KP509_15G062000 [Ceratopteris richardii]|uniref:PPPDE domain-containing protein n=1 Tax=Ceratopteris richardii TaxID=49495 RepID=A0A8T2T5A6_CERRI|nr:hypothetical protein KP509_15G062000 [Ceratopteris richardii]
MEEKHIPGEVLKLNIYDLTHMNGYMYWFGLGVYHSAIEAYGMEYAFGAHDYPTTGVFEVEPRQCPGFKFRKSLSLGTIWMGPETFREFVEDIANEYSGDSYHLLFKNCNHFCDDVCMRLTGSHLPSWINRLARLGALCRCFIPDVLQPEGLKAHESEISDSDNGRVGDFTFCFQSETSAVIASQRNPMAYQKLDSICYESVSLCKAHDIMSNRSGDIASKDATKGNVMQQ